MKRTHTFVQLGHSYSLVERKQFLKKTANLSGVIQGTNSRIKAAPNSRIQSSRWFYGERTATQSFLSVR
jgi:hypothetical protein